MSIQMTRIDATTELPDAWPDLLKLWRPGHLSKLLLKLLGYGLTPVELPAGLKLRTPLPGYLLQEFHNLPNGNYSRNIAGGYSNGFDRVMLGKMKHGRQAIAQALSECHSVLDVGCGAGGSTAAISAVGVARVVGLDASPYLLKQAQTRYPTLEFLQGLAEQTELPTAGFDGISACFLFHELPPERADLALAEFGRLLTHNGLLVILEPAQEQYVEHPLKLLRQFGWRGLYFSWLAHFVNEPFVSGWHQREVSSWLRRAGFELLEDRLIFPSRLLIARRC